MSKKVHEVQKAKSNLECALSKERIVRVGLQILKKSGVKKDTEAEVKRDIVAALLTAVRYYLLAGAYENTKQLISMCQAVTWLSEQENAELRIHELKVKLVEGHVDEVEPRAQDWLRLCMERGWKQLQPIVARLISTLSKLAEG